VGLNPLPETPARNPRGCREGGRLPHPPERQPAAPSPLSARPQGRSLMRTASHTARARPRRVLGHLLTATLAALGALSTALGAALSAIGLCCGAPP
jgi:hypothetical protein